MWTGREYGYGIVNPISLLAVDPTQYPDENPLFVVSLDDPRCGVNPADYDDCDWALMLPVAEDVWPTDSEALSPGTKPGAESGAGILVLGAAVVAGLGILATAVIVPIVVVRSKKRRAAEMLADEPTQQV